MEGVVDIHDVAPPASRRRSWTAIISAPKSVAQRNKLQKRRLSDFEPEPPSKPPSATRKLFGYFSPRSTPTDAHECADQSHIHVHPPHAVPLRPWTQRGRALDIIPNLRLPGAGRRERGNSVPGSRHADPIGQLSGPKWAEPSDQEGGTYTAPSHTGFIPPLYRQPRQQQQQQQQQQQHRE